MTENNNSKNDKKSDKDSLSLWDLMARKRIKEMANTNLRIKDMLDEDTLRKIQSQGPRIQED